VSANLTITPKPITITADPHSKVYGDDDPALTYQVTPPLVSGDAFSGALSRTPGEDVGDYAIHQNTLTAGDNYAITYVSANLTITTKPINVTADPLSKVYGDTDPALTYQVDPPLVSGDAFSGALSRAPGEDVSVYAIQQHTLTAGDNYAITYVSANLTITTKPITVTADPLSKVYGDDDPSLTYQFTPPLISGDAFSGALSRELGENVGTYAILQHTLTAGDNYAITYVSANLTITQRPITVTANPLSKVYGDDDPALTYQVTPPLVSGDAFSGALARSPGKNVGI
jgi:hypothetical protein